MDCPSRQKKVVDEERWPADLANNLSGVWQSETLTLNAFKAYFHKGVWLEKSIRYIDCFR